MKARLNIDGNDVGFSDLLPISVNMAIADIREPDKRNSSYSKTIIIPGTKETNKIFEFIFEVNIEGNSFNPNLKTPAAYYVNEIRVFNGDIQLLKIKKKYNGTVLEVNYECSIIGETGNLFLDISQLFLTDIDFSDLDHNLTYASGLFNPVMGSGYCYPYIDYGVQSNGQPCGSVWNFDQLKPAIFEKEYIDRIFSDAGYTYTSSYLTSAYEKSIIIPDPNEGQLRLDQATVDANQFYAGRLSASTQNIPLSYVTSWDAAPADIAPVPINNDSTLPFYDNNSLFNTATFIFSPAISAINTIQGYLTYTFTINPPAGTVYSSGSFSFNYRIEKSTNGGSTWQIAISSGAGQSGLAVLTKTSNLTVTLPAVTTGPGTIYRLRIASRQFSFTFLNGSFTPITTGSASIDWSINIGSSFAGFISVPTLNYGGLVQMNLTVPREVKQIDFLTSIIKSENLYFEIDKDNPRNYIIEPREDFIVNLNPIDWTYKLDVSKEMEIVPMGDLDAKTYRFTYKQDNDFFNEAYYNEFLEVYGSEVIYVDNDFIKNEKKIELAFSATPIAGTNANDIVAPRFYKSDGQNVSATKVNIRRLIYGGLLACNSHTLVINGSNTTVTQYPYCGHLDHPSLPTIDLCFDNPFKLYWNFILQLYTNNSRYNQRWSKFIEEITDRDSKILKAFFYLTEKDISGFSFRKLVYVNDAYYLVNKINDYDPQVSKTILVELLKLKEGAVFIPSNIFIPEDLGSERQVPQYNNEGNYNLNNGQSVGILNINNGENSFVTGEGNVIS